MSSCAISASSAPPAARWPSTSTWRPTRSCALPARDGRPALREPHPVAVRLVPDVHHPLPAGHRRRPGDGFPGQRGDDSAASKPKVPEIALFHKVFLRDVDILGRSYELGLMAEMNLRTGHPFKDMDLGLEMFRRGKIRVVPEFVRRRKLRAEAPAPPRAGERDRLLPGVLAALDGRGIRPLDSCRARSTRPQTGRTGGLGLLRIDSGSPRRRKAAPFAFR